MKKWKKKIKQKKKSKSPGKDNVIQKEMPKEIGSYHDFLVFDKNDKKYNLEFQDCPNDDPKIKDWLILRTSPYKTKSRFSTFFEEMLENDKKENKQNTNIMNKDENNNVINEDDKNKNNIINEDDKKSNIISNDNNNNIINKDDNKNLINNKVKNDNNKIINEEENKDDKDNIINLENEDYNNINNDINNIINNINKININNENESENENDNNQNINNIINNNKDNDNDNVNINDICNNKINNDRNYSEALTKTTTIDSNKLMSERNLSELSISSSYNVNFPLMAPGSFEQNNILYNNINPYGKKSLFSNYSGQQELKKSIYSHYSGNEYQPPIYNNSSGNNSRNDSELQYSTSIKSNFSLFERNSSVEQFQPERKIIELNVDMKKVICLEDIRTTIMIKNIPNKFTRDLLLKIIDQNFKGAYDLFILPTDVNRYKNFGYAFINFSCSYYIPYFYGLFNGKKWGSTNSQKICEITYSKIQGKNNLLSHYSNKIIFRNDDVKKYDIDQKFIIPNSYKEIFIKAFPNYNIEEFKYYFITKMPIKY